ncbi:MAG TPA: hypothetical protein VG844_02175 [Terracidiphilus sp.]|nr:hypothetical protein [Terracidiphilus sp.]
MAPYAEAKAKVSLMRHEYVNEPSRPLPTRPWRRRATKLNLNTATTYLMNALIVIIGLTSPFTIKIVGSLPLGEIVLLLSLPSLLIMQGKNAFGGRRNTVVVLIAIWLLGQIVTDFYRNTDRYDWMRGQATIVFFLIDFICLAILTRENLVRKVAFLLAFAVGLIFAIRYQPNEMIRDYSWKFGYALPVTILVLLVASLFYRFRIYPIVLACFVLLIFFNFIFSFRSEILFLFVTIVLVVPLIPERIGRVRLLPPRKSIARVFVLAGLAVIGGGLSILSVNFIASAGLGGRRAQEKNTEQLESKQGLLLSGRPEILVSSQAVLDSPILGHGSWAKDPKYAEMLHDVEVRNGVSTLDMQYILEETNGLIPAHSQLMGAWVFAGIAGVPIWIYLFWISLKAVSKISLYRPALTPLYCWLFTSFLWAILFSPFGSTVRITEAFTINIVIDILNSGGPAHTMKRGRKFGKWKRTIRRRQALQNA